MRVEYFALAYLMLGQLITRTGSGQASYLYVNGPVTLGGTLDIVAGYGFQFAAGETFSVSGASRLCSRLSGKARDRSARVKAEFLSRFFVRFSYEVSSHLVTT